MLAMHMADSLLTPGVAGVLIGLAAMVLGVAARRAQRRLDPGRVPLMGVLGAFVFAAQMINFPILAGTSGHLGGGLLLAIVLGPDAAVLVMASILIVQALIFQDGGLLALGANIVNMGAVPCYGGYWVYRTVARANPRPRRAYAAIFIAALTAVAGGAALVAVEVRWSNLLRVPFAEFLLLMVGLHLLIGLVEGFITFGVVGYLARVRPQLVDASAAIQAGAGRLSTRWVAGSFAAVALVLAGLVSLYASNWPDALESLVSGEGGKPAMVRPNESGAMQKASGLQERVAPLPEYRGIWGWSTAGGVIGTAITLGIVWVVSRGLRGGARERHVHDSQ